MVFSQLMPLLLLAFPALATAAPESTALPAAVIPAVAWHPPLAAAPDSTGPAGREAAPAAGSAVRWIPGEPAADSAATRAGPAPGPIPDLYLWVPRTALLQPAEIARIVERARAIGARGLLAQVVGRGDAYYRSDALPPSEALSEARRAVPGYDPLDSLVTRAHAAGVEVHAWMNCLLVWSAPGAPRDPRHVLNLHPEWVARLRDGRRMTQLRAFERRRLGVEGVFLAPGRPGVRAWLGGIAREIATRYPVDGVHLDYIRQPMVEVGYDADTRARFALEQGVDPANVGRLSPGGRAGLDSTWRDFQRRQVTAVVEAVRESLDAARPGILLTAAVLPTTAAQGAGAQPWREWLGSGLIDRAFVMCYAPEVQTVLDQLTTLAADAGAGGRLIPGIAVYNTPPRAAASKILAARELGFHSLALYSYDTLFSRPLYWPELRGIITTTGLGRPPQEDAWSPR